MIQFIQVWWAHLGSNQGPTGYEPVALPLSYRPKLAYKIILKILAYVKIRIATKRYRPQASTGQVCPFGTGPKSFFRTYQSLFIIYHLHKFRELSSFYLQNYFPQRAGKGRIPAGSDFGLRPLQGQSRFSIPYHSFSIL